MGTNRKETRKLLNKVSALQKEAFDCGLNMEISTRLKTENNRPWIVGYVWEEGHIEDREEFHCYEWRGIEENEEEIEKIEQIIKNYKK